MLPAFRWGDLLMGIPGPDYEIATASIFNAHEQRQFMVAASGIHNLGQPIINMSLGYLLCAYGITITITIRIQFSDYSSRVHWYCAVIVSHM